ncbi:hypothetical protein ACWGKQ_31805 [Streptomyces sp. NPDC054770]
MTARQSAVPRPDVPAGAPGPARHGVLPAILAEQPAPQAGVRERLARAGGRFDARLDGRLLTVVRSAARPSPSRQDLAPASPPRPGRSKQSVATVHPPP